MLPNTIYNNTRVPNQHYNGSHSSHVERESLREKKKKRKGGCKQGVIFWYVVGLYLSSSFWFCFYPYSIIILFIHGSCRFIYFVYIYTVKKFEELNSCIKNGYYSYLKNSAHNHEL